MTLCNPCRVAVGVSMTVMLLGGISVAIWALGETHRYGNVAVLYCSTTGFRVNVNVDVFVKHFTNNSI